MRSTKLTCLLCMFLLLLPLTSASDLVGGEDENPSPGDAPFTIIARDSPSIDGEIWSLTIEMNEEEAANNTVFEFTLGLSFAFGSPRKSKAKQGRQGKARQGKIHMAKQKLSLDGFPDWSP